MASIRLGHINDAVLALWIHRNGLISYDLLPKMKNKCHCYIVVFTIQYQTTGSKKYFFQFLNVQYYYWFFFSCFIPFFAQHEIPAKSFHHYFKSCCREKKSSSNCSTLMRTFSLRLNCREFMSVVLQELQKALGTFNYTIIGLAERERVTVVVEGSHFGESIEFISWFATHTYVHS